MNINQHPAPGLGILQAGWFAVPQDPFKPVTYTPRIGEILDATYVVPQNPLRAALAGSQQLIGRDPNAPGMVNGKSACGGGVGDCGCGGGCGGHGTGGLGDLSTDWTALTSKITAGDYAGAIQSPVFGIPAWALLGGVVAIGLLIDGASTGATYGRRRNGSKRNPKRNSRRRRVVVRRRK